MKSKSIIAFIVCILISILFVTIYINDNLKLKKIDNTQLSLSDTTIKFKIEDAKINGNYLYIDGWALQSGKTYEYFNWVSGKNSGVYNNNIIVLQDSTGQIFETNTTSYLRTDINEKINDGIDHRNCGIKSAIKISKLTKNETYKIGIILIDLDKNKNLVMSDKEITI